MTHRTFAPEEAMDALAWLNSDEVVPSWRRRYQDLKIVERALALENHVVHDQALAAAIIRALPDALVAASGWVGLDGERDAASLRREHGGDLVELIRGLGWAAERRGDTVFVGGLWGDYLPVGCFAAIVALAPALDHGQGVFGDLDGDPVLAYEVLSGKTRITNEIDKTVEYFF